MALIYKKVMNFTDQCDACLYHHLFRIERLWRDVYTQVLDLFHTLFYHLEMTGLLNPDDEIHIFALHWTFSLQLQHQLNTFKEAWNFHRLRTENGRSPYQLWLQNRDAADDLGTVCLHIKLTLTLFLVHLTSA